jgi:hypothetical protein
MNATLRLCLIALVAVAFSGCQTYEDDFPRIINEPMPVSPAQRASFGLIGILPVDIATHFEFGQPDSPGEAADVIGTKAFIGLADTSTRSDEGHPGRQLGDLAFSAALAGMIGVFGGMLAGVPESDVRQAQTAMSRALRDNPLEAGIQTQLQRLVVKKHCQNLVPIPETIREKLIGQAITKKGLRALAGSGIDSVLCLRAESERFAPGTGLNPPMAVAINLQVQIVRVADGKLLFDKVLEYEGDKLPFTRWGANHARLFRGELQVAQRTFAGVIFDELSN